MCLKVYPEIDLLVNKLRFIFQWLLFGWLKCVEIIGISGSSWNLQMKRLLWFISVELECRHVHNWMNPCFCIMLRDLIKNFTMKQSWNQFLWYDQRSAEDSNYKYSYCAFYRKLVLDFLFFSFLSFHSFKTTSASSNKNVHERIMLTVLFNMSSTLEKMMLIVPTSLSWGCTMVPSDPKTMQENKVMTHFFCHLKLDK